MSKKRRDKEYLQDIQEAMQRILTYTANLTYERFIKDVKTQDAVIRNVEIVGEATKSLSPRLRKASPHIPWREMAGMRDKVIHHYFGINLEIVWSVAKQEIPSLLSHIVDLLRKETV